MADKPGVIWWDSMCGHDTPYDAFWDDDLTVNTDTPDVTDCFQNTVLTWLPALWVLLGSCIYMLVLRSLTTHHVPFRGYNRLGQLQLVGLAVLIRLELRAIIISSPDGMLNPAHSLSPAIRLGAYVTALVFGITCSKYGIHNTGVLYVYWLFSFVASAINIRSKLIRGMFKADFNTTDTVLVLQFTVIAFEFTTNFFADGNSLDRPLSSEEKENSNSTGSDQMENITRYHPEISVSFPCTVYRMWVIKYVWKAYTSKLAWSDLWKLSSENTSEIIVSDFQRSWRKQLSVEEKLPESDSALDELLPKQSGRGHSAKDTDKFETTTGKNDTTNEDDLTDGKGFMLGKALFRSLGLRFAAGSVFLYSMECAANFCKPFLLRALIAFVESDNPHVWKGCLYAFGIFASITLRYIMGKYHRKHNFVFMWRVKTALISAIYRKSLKLSARAKKNRTVGEIVNLMSIDAEKASHFCFFSYWFWSFPFVFGMAIYLLWNILGYACLIGVLYMSVVLPLTSSTIARHFTLINKKISENRDERIKLTIQVLSGIKVLKLYGWEPYFERKVDEIRQREYVGKRFQMLLQSTNDLVWECTPYVVTGLCFAGFLYFNPDVTLDAQTIFVSMSLLNILRVPIHELPQVIDYGSLCFVSLKRVSKFLQLEEIDEHEVTCIPDGDSCIRVNSGRFTWGEKNRSALSNIDVNVKQGELIGIVGEVGSGKSSLISAILGEMIKLDGAVNIVGTRAYVPQQAWIQYMTLRNNVLFGKEYDKARYDSVIRACALEHDLKILPEADLTEIGEKGINLSGGQKQRVSLARAVYRDADVYLLDDPLSAVDAHVGNHIFNEVIGPEGQLKNKTRILVTNQIKYLHVMDKIIVMDDCEISEQGGYEELMGKNGRFAQFIKTHSNDTDSTDSMSSDDSDYNDDDTKPKGHLEATSLTQSGLRRRKHKKVFEINKNCAAGTVEHNKKNVDAEKGKEIEVESMRYSALKWFIEIASWKGTFVVIMCVISSRILEAISNIWLSVWSEEGIAMSKGCFDSIRQDGMINNTVCYKDDYKDEPHNTPNIWFVIGVYTILGIAQAVCAALNTFLTRLGAHTACNYIHRRLLNNIARAPMSFFDTTPLGKIIIRFSKDIDSIDKDLPMGAKDMMHCIVPICISVLLISYNLPLFLVTLLPLAPALLAIKISWTPCNIQLGHMVSNRTALMFSFFGESLNGATSIRAYGCQDRFIRHNEQLCDNRLAAVFANRYMAWWMHLSGELVADLSVLCCALSVVIYRDLLTPSVVGLVIIYSFRISDEMVEMLHSSTMLESATVAVQRVREYIAKPTEANWLSDKCDKPIAWPEHGKVVFNNYSTRYRPELGPVLKGLNCTIQPSEKVGIVGRTGAGKSSMTLALFRIIEATEGQIEIDGIDIASLGLHDLRCKLAIIPQDPVLFSGSLRFNLDPASKFSDEDILKALRLSHLEAFVRTLPEELDYECGEDGKNLSIGQRQLICLARALLRKNRILVLDEATASVDLDTDALIQETIQSEFKHCTVITIAHRLNTIIDYDKIMLLESGRIKEFDSPKQLLTDNTSAFFSMAKDAGLV